MFFFHHFPWNLVLYHVLFSVFLTDPLGGFSARQVEKPSSPSTKGVRWGARFLVTTGFGHC